MNMQLEQMEIQLLNDFKYYKLKVIQKIKSFVDIELIKFNFKNNNHNVNRNDVEFSSKELIKWTDYIKQVRKLYGVNIHLKNVETLGRLDASQIVITQSTVESTLSEILSMIRIHEVILSFKKKIRHLEIVIDFGKSQKMDSDILKFIINNRQSQYSDNRRRLIPSFKVNSNEIQIFIPFKKI